MGGKLSHFITIYTHNHFRYKTVSIHMQSVKAEQITQDDHNESLVYPQTTSVEYMEPLK